MLKDLKVFWGGRPMKIMKSGNDDSCVLCPICFGLYRVPKKEKQLCNPLLENPWKSKKNMNANSR